jgi:23S rRNA pseudouridine1911/1915/1917 synthase
MPKIIATHEVKTLECAVRIQEYGVAIFPSIRTKSGLKKIIKKELILVDGKIASTATFISGGERIELLEAPVVLPRKRFILDLEVLFEDDYLAVIFKPPGILVSGNGFKTILNAVGENLVPSTCIDATIPVPVHRLDYPTTGLLLVGKTKNTIVLLNKLFEQKEIRKVYHAVTIGEMNKTGTIVIPIDAKESISEYEVLKTVSSVRFTQLNLVRLHPKTGRRHQLRKHLLAIGNPILGDATYFLESLNLKGKGMYLHASTLKFNHPITNQSLVITSELPEKFKKLFNDAILIPH